MFIILIRSGLLKKHTDAHSVVSGSEVNSFIKREGLNQPVFFASKARGLGLVNNRLASSSISAYMETWSVLVGFGKGMPFYN